MTILKHALKRRFDIPVPAFNPAAILVVLIVMALVSNLASYAAGLTPAESGWAAHLGLYALAVIGKYGVMLIVAVLAWTLGVKAWRWIAPAVETGKTEGQSQPEPPEANEITASLQVLTKTLAQVEQDKNAATLLLTDAQTQSNLLVMMIKAIAGKAEAYERQGKELETAMAAIAGGDRKEMARAAGAVSDAHIRALILCEVTDPGYWQSVTNTIAAECGTLSQWADGYKRFAGRLLLDFSRVKSRLTALDAASDLVDVARPLAIINRNVDTAGRHLQLKNRPGLAAAGELPALN